MLICRICRKVEHKGRWQVLGSQLTVPFLREGFSESICPDCVIETVPIHDVEAENLGNLGLA